MDTTHPAQVTDGYGTTTTEMPTAEQTAEHLAILLRTSLPQQYRAAVARRGDSFAGGGRPTNARIGHAWEAGTVYGIQVAVQALFGYFFFATAADLLDVAVADLA